MRGQAVSNAAFDSCKHIADGNSDAIGCCGRRKRVLERCRWLHLRDGCWRLCRGAGTLAYMAPECFDLRVGKLTDKADIFSFGVLVWEMVVGKPPWQVRVGFMLCSWALPGGENRVAS